MAITIVQLVNRVIGVEGGYVDHPADRGGPTRWGITEQVARAHGYRGDMRTLPREVAVQIYALAYWSEIGLDRVAEIAPDIAAELFDIAVNMGTAWAGRILQRVLNALNRGASDYPDMAVDGRIGTMTIDALARFLKLRGEAGATVLLRLITCLRGARYVDIVEANPSQEVFLYGWIANRVGAGLGQ